MKLEMIKFDKIVGEYYWGAHSSMYRDQEKVDGLKEALPLLENFTLTNLKGQ